jgi:hypothetical protein
VEDIADKALADTAEDKDDIPNSGRDSPNMDAKTPNMDRKAPSGRDTPNKDRNIPNRDRDRYMGSRAGKGRSHDRGNDGMDEFDMGEDAHNLDKKTTVPGLDWLPSMKSKA